MDWIEILFWLSSGSLIHADLQLDYLLRASLWFVGFLVCGSLVADQRPR